MPPLFVTLNGQVCRAPRASAKALIEDIRKSYHVEIHESRLFTPFITARRYRPVIRLRAIFIKLFTAAYIRRAINAKMRCLRR